MRTRKLCYRYVSGRVLQKELAAQVGGRGLKAEINPDDWHRDPKKTYIGVEIIPPELNGLRASVRQKNDSMLYFVILCRTPRVDYEVLCRRAAIRTLRAELRRKYGDEWQPPDQHQLGWIYRDVTLRSDDVAERLARSAVRKFTVRGRTAGTYRKI